MKKALSIILCLAMLMSTVPVSVFAAPAAVTTGDSATEFVPELPNDDSAEAELAAEGTVMPVKVLPKNGETVNRSYPVAYYTFAKNVVINKDDVTLENIGNDQVGGVYFEVNKHNLGIPCRTLVYRLCYQQGKLRGMDFQYCSGRRLTPFFPRCEL